MRTLLLASAAAFALAMPAQAQIVCANCDTEIGALWRHVEEIGKWGDQLNAMGRQLETLHNQYAAIAHLPQNVMGMGRQLTQVPSLQNPLPQAGEVSGILNGSSLGPVSGLASGFMQQNRYAAPTGTDFTAQEINARAQGLAGIQAIAASGMQSVEQRIASLKEFAAGIEGSPDVQQSAAIQARLQLEQNYVAAQQVQATQLAVLVQAQQQISDQRVLEKQRADAEELDRATSGVPLP